MNLNDQPITTNIVGDLYFNSLNDLNQQDHAITKAGKNSSDVDADVRSWYAGFRSAIQGVKPNLTATLPPTTAVTSYVNEHFQKRAKIAA